MEWENRRHGKQFESEERLGVRSLTSAASTSDLSLFQTARWGAAEAGGGSGGGDGGGAAVGNRAWQGVEELRPSARAKRAGPTLRGGQHSEMQRAGAIARLDVSS